MDEQSQNINNETTSSNASATASNEQVNNLPLNPSKPDNAGMKWGIVLVIILALIFVILLAVYFLMPARKTTSEIVPQNRIVEVKPTVLPTAIISPTPSDEVSALQNEASNAAIPDISSDISSLDQQLTH